MLEAFKLKPFDLEPIYASWTDGPRFLGDAKTDPPVDEWLKQIKAGCIERNIPNEYWHKVGQHFMGDRAKARLQELKTVMSKVHGGKYRWSWKKFKIAMRNMGWTIDATETETIKVQSKASSGGWWWTRKDEQPAPVPPPASSRPQPTKSASTDTSFWLNRKNSKDQDPTTEKSTPTTAVTRNSRPIPVKSHTDSFWLSRKPSILTKSDTDEVSLGSESGKRPDLVQSFSNSVVNTMRGHGDGGTHKPTPTRSESLNTISTSGENITTVTHAPVWLLNACNALDFLNTEHPKVMSTLSAILITAGTLPAIPAISAGAGGAVLASGAAHAVGAIAVGVGSWLKAQQEGQIQANQSQAQT